MSGGGMSGSSLRRETITAAVGAASVHALVAGAAGQQDDRHLPRRIEGPELRAAVDALGAGRAHVQQDQVRRVVAHEGEQPGVAGVDLHRVSLRGEPRGQEDHPLRLVVHEEHAGGLDRRRREAVVVVRHGADCRERPRSDGLEPVPHETHWCSLSAQRRVCAPRDVVQPWGPPWPRNDPPRRASSS
jgi:hypothetical protein